MTSPELTAIEEQLLKRARQLGYQFHLARDSAGNLSLILGVRTWQDGTADAVSIHSGTSAQALRANPAGDTVWKMTDTMRVVLEALVTLPDPRHPQAPRRVLAGGRPPDLWTPGS